jgi:YggT family protein
MGEFLVPVIQIVKAVLNIYWWVIIISAIASWLVVFGVINTYNNSVRTVLDVLYRLTEPVYRHIRQFLPNLGGVDVSPIIVLLIIYLIDMELTALANHLYSL